MLTRREFLAAAGAVATVQGASLPRRAMYDLIVANGRVIDPSARLDRVADIAIRGGRIAAVQPGLAATDAAEVIEARGMVVTPGLLDIHAHTSAEMPPAHCLSTGVTAVVDAGSGGADTIDQFVQLAKAASNRVRLLVNLGRTGLGPKPELLDFVNADAAAARRAIEANRDFVIGIKARLSANVVGDHALDAIDRAHPVTVPLNLPFSALEQSVSPSERT